MQCLRCFYCLYFRELAFQIAEQFNVLGKPIGVRVSVITGGLGMYGGFCKPLNPLLRNSAF